MTTTQRQAQLAAVVLYIGPANSRDILGQNWRWTRDTARRLGVEVLRVGGKPLIRASELAAALEAEARKVAPAVAAPLSDEDERRRLAAQIGMRRRPGAA